jgi:hypothetical protein
MPIYTKWGDRVEIVENAGRHKPSWAEESELTLVRLVYPDDGYRTRFEFAHALRAEGGWPVIEAAVNAAPKLELAGAALVEALKEAE